MFEWFCVLTDLNATIWVMMLLLRRCVYLNGRKKATHHNGHCVECIFGLLTQSINIWHILLSMFNKNTILRCVYIWHVSVWLCVCAKYVACHFIELIGKNFKSTFHTINSAVAMVISSFKYFWTLRSPARWACVHTPTYVDQIRSIAINMNGRNGRNLMQLRNARMYVQQHFTFGMNELNTHEFILVDFWVENVRVWYMQKLITPLWSNKARFLAYSHSALTALI